MRIFIVAPLNDRWLQNSRANPALQARTGLAHDSDEHRCEDNDDEHLQRCEGNRVAVHLDTTTRTIRSAANE